MLGMETEKHSTVASLDKYARILASLRLMLAVVAFVSACSSTLAKTVEPQIRDLQPVPVEIQSLEVDVTKPKAPEQEIFKNWTDEKVKLAWDTWHRETNRKLYWDNIVPACKKAGLPLKPLNVVASFRVQRNRQITDIKLVVPSTNPVFNNIVISSITSLDKDEAWKFPDGTERETVDKTCTFGWGQGGPTHCVFPRE